MYPLVTENINQASSLPLPVDWLNKISEAINKYGIKVPKYCTTHNQSFPGPSGLSVKLRANKEALPPIM